MVRLSLACDLNLACDLACSLACGLPYPTAVSNGTAVGAIPQRPAVFFRKTLENSICEQFPSLSCTLSSYKRKRNRVSPRYCFCAWSLVGQDRRYSISKHLKSNRYRSREGIFSHKNEQRKLDCGDK